MGRTEPHTVIIGGGVIGVCCAYFLARRGARVTVLERDEIGRGASYGNAGTVAPGHPPINRPGRLKQALRSLRDPLSPLHVQPRWDPALVRWLWSFAAHCSQRHLDHSMRVLAPLGQASRRLFDQLVEQEDLRCDFRPTGYTEIFISEQGRRATRTDVSIMTQHGSRAEPLDGPALREREPAIHEQVLGGVHWPDAATLNPHRFVLEMADRARRRGAVFQTGQEVSEILTRDARVRGVRTREGETFNAEAVILATGAYSPGLSRALGIRLPLQAAKGYHSDRDPRSGAAPALGGAFLLSEASVFCTPMDDFVRFAGTLEFSGVNHEIHPLRLEQLTRAASGYLRGIDPLDTGRAWCGLRPCMADGLPVVGPASRHAGLFIATGHAMQGLTLGPITGQLIAELVLDGKSSMDIRGLRVERFGSES